MTKRKTVLKSSLRENLKEMQKYLDGDPTAKVTLINAEDFHLPDPMNGADVRRVRKKLKFTQAKLARVLGESVRTVQGWESGDNCRRPNGAARRLMEMLWKDSNTVLALI